MPASRSLSAFRKRAALLACALGVVFALGTLAGCQNRLRSNPLDPENPSTGGGPVNFQALAGYSTVALTWTASPGSTQLAGFLLERRRHGPNTYVALGPLLPLSASSFDDATVTNDFDYDYRLSYVLPDGGISGTPVEREARPGQEIAWVADPGTDEIVRVTPDGRGRVFARGPVTAVNRLSVQLSGGEVWATAPIDGRVRVWSVNGAPLNSFNGLSEPNAIAVDPGTLTAWICEELGPRVRRWTQPGVSQATVSGVGLPTDVAITPGGGAWIVDQLKGRLLRVNAAGTPLDTVDVGSDPRRLAVDTLDGSVWVSRTTANEVVHVSASGNILSRTPGLPGAYAIDIDEFRNQVWISLDGANAVQVLARNDGSPNFRVSGLAHPRGLSVVDRTGECWVVAIQTHELVRISSAGAIASRFNAFSAPFDVRVDPGPR
jgi:DNA-binding beta-propeller fold protein YncE